VDRVVAAQLQIFGVLAGASRKLLVDPDRGQLRVKLLEGRKRLLVLLLPEPIQTPRSRQGRPTLWIGEDARR
jgi:hypothetical protein